MEKISFLIKDQQTLKEYLNTIDNPVFATGTFAYNLMIGLEESIKNLKNLALRKSSDSEVIERNIRTVYLKAGNYKGLTKDNFNNFKGEGLVNLFKDRIILKEINSSKKRPIVLIFKLNKNLLSTFKKNKKWIIAASDYDIFLEFGNKIRFQELLKELNLPAIKSKIARKDDNLYYAKLKKDIGSKMVIQFPYSEFGLGTFFIKNERDFSKFLSNNKVKEYFKSNSAVKISKFIKHKFSPAMAVCATKFGIINTRLYHQIIDSYDVTSKKRGSGIFCGNDWTNANFSNNIQNQANKIAQKIGAYLNSKCNFKGLFGIDFVLENKTQKLYPVEINVRLLGSFPLLTMSQGLACQPCIQAIQIIECLNRNDYRIDIKSVNRRMQNKSEGAQLNVYLKSKKPYCINKELKAGIYLVKNGKIIFKRAGYKLKNLDAKEIAVVNVPLKNSVIRDYKRLCVLISRNSFLRRNGKLNKFVKPMIQYVYKNLGLKPLKKDA